MHSLIAFLLKRCSNEHGVFWRRRDTRAVWNFSSVSWNRISSRAHSLYFFSINQKHNFQKCLKAKNQSLLKSRQKKKICSSLTILNNLRKNATGAEKRLTILIFFESFALKAVLTVPDELSLKRENSELKFKREGLLLRTIEMLIKFRKISTKAVFQKIQRTKKTQKNYSSSSRSLKSFYKTSSSESPSSYSIPSETW